VRQDDAHCAINIAMSQKRTVQLSLVLLLLTVLAAPLPAFAYGDPSGGLLFQTLTPLLAILWGAWMIFANRVRQGVRKAIVRIRGVAPADPSANDTGNVEGAD
jgi:hypothetical protein